MNATSTNLTAKLTPEQRAELAYVIGQRVLDYMDKFNDAFISDWLYGVFRSGKIDAALVANVRVAIKRFIRVNSAAS